MRGLSVYAAQLGLLRTLRGSLREGRFLTSTSRHHPEVVLGTVTGS